MPASISPPLRPVKKGNWYSFLEFLRTELGTGSSPSEQILAEQTAQQVTDFLRTPLHLEKLLYFGFFLCLDSFLFIFTFLPLRILLAIPRLLINTLLGRRPRLGPSNVCDLSRGGVVVIVCFLLQFIDASRLYHLIRNQDTIKLYVIFNVLEVFDKYCAWLGQDILDALFSRHHAKRMFVVAVIYTFIHSLINFCQVMTLNVAINSYSTALLTMLVSNQFVEIKGNVFKKFGREQIEKIAGNDIVERFNMIVFLAIITIRNFGELGWTWGVLEGEAWLLLSVFCSEMFVDWIKHAFLSRFNGFTWDVYDHMSHDLARDLLLGHALDSGTSGQQRRKFLDQPHLVTRKLGFVSLPIACLLVRVLVQSLPRPRWDRTGLYLCIVIWLGLVCLKVLVGVLMLGRAASVLQRSARLAPPTAAINKFDKFVRQNSEKDKAWVSRANSLHPPTDAGPSAPPIESAIPTLTSTTLGRRGTNTGMLPRVAEASSRESVYTKSLSRENVANPNSSPKFNGAPLSPNPVGISLMNPASSPKLRPRKESESSTFARSRNNSLLNLAGLVGGGGPPQPIIGGDLAREISQLRDNRNTGSSYVPSAGLTFGLRQGSLPHLGAQRSAQELRSPAGLEGIPFEFFPEANRRVSMNIIGAESWPLQHAVSTTVPTGGLMSSALPRERNFAENRGDNGEIGSSFSAGVGAGPSSFPFRSSEDGLRERDISSNRTLSGGNLVALISTSSLTNQSPATQPVPIPTLVASIAAAKRAAGMNERSSTQRDERQ